MNEQLQPLFDRCKTIQTDTMTYEDWLILRRNSIGGSDAGSLMLLNGEYGSPNTIYWQKKGKDKSADMSPAAKRGKLLEPVIRNWFAEAHPELKIFTVPYMFYSPDFDYMSANVDGIIYAENPVIINDKEIAGFGGLEIKSSKYGYDFNEDEIPDSYFAQVQHYMYVLGLKWFVISACFLDTEEIKDYVIFRNDQFIVKMLTVETKFWNENVIPENRPPAVGIPAEDDMITGMYEGCAAPLTLTANELNMCRKICHLKEQIAPLEKEDKAVKIELKSSLIARAKPSKTERKLSASGDQYSVSWSFFDRRSVDSDALKDAGLYDQYSKVTPSDRLTVTAKKVV
ncbi:MAG: YqaJ viral recombinase family protein [Treponema sp.]|nr:YqaJ viral recombinase family protein [Treponema sp.]